MEPITYVWNRFGQKLRPILGPTIHMRANSNFYEDTPNNNCPSRMNTETRTVDLKLQIYVAPVDPRANKIIWMELMARKARAEQNATRAQSARAASEVSQQGNM